MFGFSRKKNAQRETVDLDTFLNRLAADDAAKVKAAAARIDELEHAAQRIGHDDDRYVYLFAGAGVLILAATFFALGGYDMYPGGFASLADLAVLLMAAAFPALVIYYSLRVRERTSIDKQQFEIIETYFMPHGAIYLPPGRDRSQGMVTISPDAKAWRSPNVKEIKKAGWYW